MVMTGGIWSIQAEGQPVAPGDEATASLRYVTPGYFATLGIRLLEGRDVAEADTGAALQAAVVSESFAERYWPGQDPLGRRFHFGLLGSTGGGTSAPFQDRTVVGVAADVKVRGLERKSEPQVYLPYRQQPDDTMSYYAPKDLAVKLTGDPASLLPAAAEDRRPGRSGPAPLRRAQPRRDRRGGDRAPPRPGARPGGIRGRRPAAGRDRHPRPARVHGVEPRPGDRRAHGAGRVAPRHPRAWCFATAWGSAFWAWAWGSRRRSSPGGASKPSWPESVPSDALTFLAAAGVALSMTLLGSLLPALRAIRVDPLTVMRAE